MLIGRVSEIKKLVRNELWLVNEHEQSIFFVLLITRIDGVSLILVTSDYESEIEVLKMIPRGCLITVYNYRGRFHICGPMPKAIC